MDDQILHRFRKSGTEEIVIALRTYQGNDFVDIRTFFGAQGQETKPTRKGVTIPLVHYREFRKAIPVLDEVMSKEGWD